MSEKDLEAIVTEILANSEPSADGGQYVKIGRRMPDNIRRQPPIAARPRKRRPLRNPLYTSLRVMIVGLVILLVPLLFS